MKRTGMKAVAAIVVLLGGALIVWLVGMPYWREQRVKWNESTAQNLVATGRYAEAEQMLTDALSAAEAFGPADRRLDKALNQLGDVYAAEGKYSESQSVYLRALQNGIETGTFNKADVARTLDKLGHSYRAQQNLSAAEGLFNQSLDAWAKSGTPESPEAALTMQAQAQLLVDQGRLQDAEPLLAHALAIREKALAPTDPNLVQTLEVYALVLRGLGQADRAEAMRVRAAAGRPEGGSTRPAEPAASAGS